ncbi:MAG: outer membrane protein assembly factor BamA [Bacteroidales bacterium]|nr:outer membrane protein assembly factor BamA [Bacteroidales bacterium]
MKNNILIIILMLILSSTVVYSQDSPVKDNIDYTSPKEYFIGGISISGVKYLDNNVLIMISGLSVGDKITIPGDDIAKAIKKLWKQGLFEDVKISYTKIQGDKIYLDIELIEMPKLNRFSFRNIKKSEADDLREELGIVRGNAVNENMIVRSKNIINQYFVDKGFYFIETKVIQKRDSILSNQVTVIFDIKKNEKVKINEIHIVGSSDVDSEELKMKMKETKEKRWYRVWKKSKYIKNDFDGDMQSVMAFYNKEGYRDARIISDSIVKINDKLVDVYVNINEGTRFYFGEINWVGNTKYNTSVLNAVLRIKTGDVYDREMLETRLFMDMEKGDVHSLYMNQGYLFSSITPVESKIKGDTIDLEIRIYEGKQAIVSSVTIKGNTKTHDNVILREIRTKPGQLFNRADIIRTQRELAQLQYFDPQKLNVNPKPNPADGTVDIEYIVEETSSDQIEMSLGWGMGALIGTVGVSFNNFSLKGVGDKKSWRPIPSGDGQKLSLRIQSNGIYYQSYSASFTEPWLGGKKPMALSVSAYQSVQTNGQPKGAPNRSAITISGVTVGLGKRLQWPDDYFQLYQSISIQNYNLNNYARVFSFDNGNSNNLSYTVALSRNSVDAPIYPTSGSDISTSVQFTPPYSLLNNKDYTHMEDSEKFNWIEYYKIKVKFSFFTYFGKSSAERKLVLHARAKFGFLGYYNEDIGYSPFERFYLGGDGLSGYSLDGRELIGMRGYTNNSLSPANGATVYTKYTMELRYPISTNPMATVYVLGFVEAGNSWATLNMFNPYDVHRSAGVGARIYLPMFGLLGLDWAYGFDPIPGFPGMAGTQFHFSMNGSID